MFTANTKDFQTKFINKLTFWEKIPKKLVAKKKLVDFSLPDGSRLNATIPPLSPNGYTTTIRVFRKRPISPLELVEYNTISVQGLSLLSLLFWYGYPTRNIIVIGPTSSGKTSTVNALCSFIPSNSRIIVPEETMELNLPHPPKKVVRHIATEDTPLSDTIARWVMFIALGYILLFVIGTTVTTLYGYNASNSMYETASAVGNVGLSSGITSPAMPAMLKVTYIFLMWAGRLEIMAVLTLMGFAILGLRKGIKR
jgi:hypothetical protein